MITKEILSTEIANNVTVQDLINAFHSVMDGVQSHDIQRDTGLPDSEVDKVVEVLAATAKFWEI